MTTSLLRHCRPAALAAILTVVAAPALAQPIEAGSQDALEAPDARGYGALVQGDRSRISESARRRYYPGTSGLDAASPGLPATLPEPRGRGYAPQTGGYGTNGYAEDASRYGDAPERDDRFGQYDERYDGRRTQVAPFGGGPGQAPIPFGGSPYGGSAINGTASGPQYSTQLPASNGQFRR